MTKQICIFGKQYNSLVDSISEVDDNFTVRTKDDRFFNFTSTSVSLLNELENDIYHQRDPELVRNFVELILVKKGIYRAPADCRIFKKKQPALTCHQTLLPATMVNRIAVQLHWLFRPLLALFLVGLAVVIHATYIIEHVGNFTYRYIFTYTATDLMMVVILSLISSLIHEFGHATACHRFAGKAGEIGTGINMMVPVFFANVSNIYTLNSRKKTIVSISGLYFQVIYGTAVIIFAQWYGQLDKFITLYLIGFTFSLLPIYRNDGYWFINDLTKRQDLLNDVFAVLKRKKKASILDIAYGVFFMLTAVLVMFLILRFLTNSGPEMIRELMAVSKISFTTVLRSTLLIFHYIAIFFFFYSLLKAVTGFILITTKQKRTQNKNEKI
ncbi:hypothetical protein [Rheinheimera sp. WS51]|uniref:hypothetical protein n=1 Tax=Rheinheimera sp. WS51 TaxID=3425886 RepID=UPI003D8E33DF